MKKLFIILFILLVKEIHTQNNLVINPSFEDTLSTNFTINYPICKNWNNPNASSSDYFSPFCMSLNWGAGYCVPSNFLGYQMALDGLCYAGIVTYEPTNVTKDYLQGSLNQSLIAGNTYEVSLYVNMADSSNYSNCEIDVAFTNSLIQSTVNAGSFGFSDLVTFNTAMVDTTHWTQFKGAYTAHGGEQYIYIGSNTPNNVLTCPTYLYGNFPQASYYFIDYVSVKLIDDNIKEPSTPNVFTPNGDGINDVLYFNQQGIEVQEVIIYNRWGNMVKEPNNNNSWDGTTTAGEKCSSGIYFYIIKTTANKQLKGFINLIY